MQVLWRAGVSGTQKYLGWYKAWTTIQAICVPGVLVILGPQLRMGGWVGLPINAQVHN